MYKSVLKKIVPENVRDRRVIMDVLDVFVEFIFEYSDLALDINNLYAANNEVTFEEIIKTYAANFHKTISDGTKSTKLVEQLRKSHEKWGFTFDETRLNFRSLDLLTKEQLELFKSFQQSKGTLKSIDFIYKIIEQLNIESGVLETDGELVLKDFKDQTFHYVVEGSMLQEVFEAFVRPLSHPVGWTYLYVRTYNLHFKDYFLCKEVYTPKTFRVYCRDRNIEDNFITNKGYLLENDSNGKWLKDPQGEPRLYVAERLPVFNKTRFGTHYDTLSIKSELYLVDNQEIVDIEKESLKGNNRIKITFKSGEYLEQNSNPRSLILYYGRGPNDLKQTIKKDYTDFLKSCSLEFAYESKIVSTVTDIQQFQIDFGLASSVGNKVVIGAGNLFIGNSAWKIGDTHFNNNASVSYFTKFKDRVVLASDYKALYRFNKAKRRRVFRKITSEEGYDISAEDISINGQADGKYFWTSKNNQVFLGNLDSNGERLDVDVQLNTSGFSILSTEKNIKPIIWTDKFKKVEVVQVKSSDLKKTNDQNVIKYVPIQENVDGRQFYTAEFPDYLPLVISNETFTNVISYMTRSESGYKVVSDVDLRKTHTFCVDLSKVQETQEDKVFISDYPPLKVIDAYGKTVFTNVEYKNNKFHTTCKTGYYVIFSKHTKKFSVDLNEKNGFSQNIPGLPVFFLNNSETLAKFEVSAPVQVCHITAESALKLDCWIFDFKDIQQISFGDEIIIPEVPRGKYVWESEKPILNVFKNNKRVSVGITRDIDENGKEGLFKFYTDELADYQVQVLNDKKPLQFKSMKVDFTKQNNYSVTVDFKERYVLNYYYKSIKTINTTYKDYEGNYRFDSITLKAEGINKDTKAIIYYIENIQETATAVYFENRNIENVDYPITIKLNNETITFKDSSEAQVDTRDYLKLYFNQDLRDKSGIIECFDSKNSIIETVDFNLTPVATLKKQNETTYEVDLTELNLRSKELLENEVYEDINPEHYNNFIGHFALNDYDFDNIYLRNHSESNRLLLQLRRVGNCGIFAHDEFSITGNFVRLPQTGEISFEFTDYYNDIFDTFPENFLDYYENLNRLEQDKKKEPETLPLILDTFDMGDGSLLYFMDDYLVPGDNTMRDVMPKWYPAFSGIVEATETKYSYPFETGLIPLYSFRYDNQILSDYRLIGNTYHEITTNKDNIKAAGISNKNTKTIRITQGETEIPGVPVITYINSGQVITPDISFKNNKFFIKTDILLNVVYTTKYTEKTLKGNQTFTDLIPILGVKDNQIFTGFKLNGSSVNVETNAEIKYYLTDEFNIFTPKYKEIEYKFSFGELIPLGTYKNNTQIFSYYKFDNDVFYEITLSKDIVAPYGIKKSLTKTVQISKDSEIPGLPIIVYNKSGISVEPDITVNNDKFTVKTKDTLYVVYTEKFKKRSLAGNYTFTNEYPVLAYRNAERFNQFIILDGKIRVETTNPEVITYYIVTEFETFKPEIGLGEDTPKELFEKLFKQIKNYEKGIEPNKIDTKIYERLEYYMIEGNN